MTINTPRRNISRNALADLIDLCKEIGWNIATIFWLWGDGKDRGNWPEPTFSTWPKPKPSPSPMSWANPLPTKEDN